jgi:hypothetical protein
LLLVLLLAFTAQVAAQAIVAPSGRTLFSGATLVRSFADVTQLSLPSKADSGNTNRWVTPLALVYGVYPQWSIIAAQPFVSVDLPGNNTSGLGDLQLFVQYDGLYSRNTPGGLTRLAGVFGLRAPTGADRFSTDAVAYTTGLIFEKQVRLKYVFTTDVEYTFATKNSAGLDAGDRLRFDAVPGYFIISKSEAQPGSGWLRRFYERLFRNGAYLLLELNGSWQARARAQGSEIPNTGGTLLWVSPGIQYFSSRSLVLELSSPIPVVKSLHEAQLEPTSRFIFGFRYLF